MATDYKLTWHEGRAYAMVDEAGEAGLRDALEYLLKVSRPLVPLDTRPGRDQVVLMNTGRVVIDPEHGVGGVVYGDESTKDYAKRQHEDLTFRHAPGRQAKFLEAPFEANKTLMLAIIAAHYRRRFR
ncbi:hypothetical protein [Dactylosporangium sp. CS-033363]|uniref:hypothetical protein n=1 Tax=Dactylosporangium sp. CS-033363 TaxID=3239935 RepID=UPI003D92268B